MVITDVVNILKDESKCSGGTSELVDCMVLLMQANHKTIFCTCNMMYVLLGYNHSYLFSIGWGGFIVLIQFSKVQFKFDNTLFIPEGKSPSEGLIKTKN